MSWNSCTCPHFRFRCQSEGLSCKHIDKFRIDNPKEKPNNEIPIYDKEIFRGGIDADKITIPSEIIDKLIMTGEILYNRKDDKYYLFE